jgi:hypothetical protein
VACAGQAVKPQEELAVEEGKAAVAPTQSEVVKEVAEPVTAPQEPEQPVVEVMPRQQVGESSIAVEAIPAQDSQEAVESSASEKQQDVEHVVAESAAVDATQEQAAAEASVQIPAATAAEPVVKEAAVTAEAVPTPSGPNNFVVTVGPKQPGHPAYGKGHTMGFLINGVSGKELVLERGKTYTFNIVTNPKHDVYLSTKAIGWGGAPYSEGVEGAYTYKGTMTFKPTASTPDKLYYACRNHPYMGAVIHIVNPGESVTIQERDITKGVAGGGETAPVAAVSQSKVKQKLMFAEMMAGSQGAKRVMASQNDEAKQLVVKSKELLAQGRDKAASGALPEALELANRSLKLISEATRLVPSEAEMAHLAEEYQTKLAEIQNYQKSYTSNVKHLEKSGGVPADAAYDEKKFAAMLADAAALAKKSDYVRANKLLDQAQRIVTLALHKMLDSKTLVYDLKFDSPADEFEYEMKRFGGYEELIPVAIEAKKPTAGAIKLMETFLDKARKRRDEAKAKAEAGDYGAAIGMMQQATKTVRRALRMVGVTQ